MVMYYADPDGNIVEVNVNNYGNEWTATEHVRSAPLMSLMAFFDPDKVIEGRKAGASHWELHQRVAAGEFGPTAPFDPRKAF